MAKTNGTKCAEAFLWRELIENKIGIYGCFEVNLGKRDPWVKGREIVDFITYQNEGTFRCYEIKVSESDFNSGAAVSFKGHFNYYVLSAELYGKVADKIPEGIGVVLFDVYSEKRHPVRAKRKIVSLFDSVMMTECMMKSLHREQAKLYKEKGYWG